VARIRSLKPEAFTSESLAAVSVSAERTVFGLSTYVDDRGRTADKPAVINGALWPLRPEHTAADTEQELAELEREAIVCRYVGCDGKRYLHLVKFDTHQRVDRPSKSRLPRCPHHPKGSEGFDEYCGRHEGPCPPRVLVEPAPSAPRGPAEPAPSTLRADGEPTASGPRDVATVSPPGSRIVDRGPRIVDLGSKDLAPSASPPIAKATKGTRIPTNFAPTPDMIEWARRETPYVGVKETAAFVDHWRSAPGQRGVRLDWVATWRNWMRRAQVDAEQRRTRASPNGLVERGGLRLRPETAERLDDRVRYEAMDAAEAQAKTRAQARPAIEGPAP
jgi:hypothetical protein